MGNIVGYRRAAVSPNASTDYNRLSQYGAVYDYDAFGREVRSAGPAADSIPFHFSSKFTDAETGLNYYGYRFYDPVAGRWLNRDPLGEFGHPAFNLQQWDERIREETNLYRFCDNRSPSAYDIDGRVVGYVVGGIGAVLIACAESQYEIALERFKDDAGYNDKFRHCWTSCRISKICGGAISEVIGSGNEAVDFAKYHWCKSHPNSWRCRENKGSKGYTPQDSATDLRANQLCIGLESLVAPAVAWIGALCRQSCEDCCKEKFGKKMRCCAK